MRSIRMTRTLVFTLISLALLSTQSTAQVTPNPAPAKGWQYYETAEEAGFTSDGIEEARQYWLTFDDAAAAIVCVYRGKILLEWGDSAFNYRCHSIRKSFLSALYGIHVEEGDIDLNKTLAELGIDDDPPLTDAEKQARVIHLLKARSGVYHKAAAETPEMDALRPERGSHAPDTFWYYNNWDFNALGTIFVQETGQDIFDEFRRAIANPIGMQDFDVALCEYQYEWDLSIHPKYAFRMSARDRARFGLLFLQDGLWGKRQLVPGDWVRESTAAYSDASHGFPEFKGVGYGYMWWNFTDDVPAFRGYPSMAGFEGFYASGYGGHGIIIIPDLDMVFVVVVDTDNGFEVTDVESFTLFDKILAARTFEAVDLSVQKVKCSKASLGPGAKARVVAKARNVSRHRSKSAEVGFYLSSDDTLDEDDVLLGTTRLPGLKANKKKKVKRTVTLPGDVEPGTYYLLAAVLSDDWNRDPHPENDAAAAKRLVTVTGQ